MHLSMVSPIPPTLGVGRGSVCFDFGAPWGGALFFKLHLAIGHKDIKLIQCFNCIKNETTEAKRFAYPQGKHGVLSRGPTQWFVLISNHKS